MMAASKTTSSGNDKSRAAKRAFFMNLIDLSWKLALSIMAPILLGAWLDNRRGHGDFFTFAGLLVGLAFGGVVIYQISKKLSKEFNK